MIADEGGESGGNRLVSCFVCVSIERPEIVVRSRFSRFVDRCHVEERDAHVTRYGTEDAVNVLELRMKELRVIGNEHND